MASQGGNKTEKPTPQRLKQAREKGQFLSARSIIAAVQFTVAVVLLGKLLPGLFSKLQAMTISMLTYGADHDIHDGEWLKLLRDLSWQSALPVLLMGSILLVLTAGANLAITQFGFSF